jgi:hypothetical protein
MMLLRAIFAGSAGLPGARHRTKGRGARVMRITRGWALAASCAFTSLLVLASPTLATTASPSDVAVESPCPNSTLGGFTPSLPDCRAYELVSNPIDETYVPPGDQGIAGGAGGDGEYLGGGQAFLEMPFQAAPDGEALAYVGGESNSGEGGTGQTSDSFGNQYLAMRGTNGWQANDISLATANLITVPTVSAFSPDLSVQTVEGLLSTTTERVSAEPEVAAECIENQLASTYSRTASGLRALITATRPGSFECEAQAAGISADNSHMLFESRGAYTPGAVEGASSRTKNIYDSVGGSLHQINILPGGEPEQPANATVGVRLVPEANSGNLDGAISPDGSRIVWSAMEKGLTASKALYVRVNDSSSQSPVVAGQCTVASDACTVQLDATQGGSGASGGGLFWAASHTGSKVFFTDCNRLTADSTANAEAPCVHEPPNYEVEGLILTGSDLYEYDFDRPAGQRLVDLTVDHHAGDTLGADVQGVIGVSQDGAYAYFVANGVLAGTNAEGQTPVAGQPNLYLAHAGTTTFIATLATSDNPIKNRVTTTGSNQHGVGDWEVPLGWRTSQVTPGGGAVAFEATRALTGYDSLGLPEVFVYQAGSERLVCASCDPSGAAPNPSLGTGHTGTSILGGFLGLSNEQFFRPRSIVEREGTQVYFMTSQPLVRYDHNGLQDVYEWESHGSGRCRQVAGCITLISDAGGLSNSYFIESGGGGRDVFFTTRSQLTAAGTGETLKLYDARVDGGRPESSQACTGTGCQGVPPAPPIFSTPASTTFNGVGNYEPSLPPPSVKAKPKPKKKPAKCKRGARKKHGRCAKRKAHRARTLVNAGRGGGN